MLVDMTSLTSGDPDAKRLAVAQLEQALTKAWFQDQARFDRIERQHPDLSVEEIWARVDSEES
jgi:hypothetical protein